MNHAITLGGLLAVLGVLGGIVTALFGGFIFMAGAMSDAPAEGDSAGKTGCITVAVGMAVLAISIFVLR